MRFETPTFLSWSQPSHHESYPLRLLPKWNPRTSVQIWIWGIFNKASCTILNITSDAEHLDPAQASLEKLASNLPEDEQLGKILLLNHEISWFIVDLPIYPHVYIYICIYTHNIPYLPIEHISSCISFISFTIVYLALFTHIYHLCWGSHILIVPRSSGRVLLDPTLGRRADGIVVPTQVPTHTDNMVWYMLIYIYI